MKAKIIGTGLSGKAAEYFLTTRKIESIVVADPNENVNTNYDFCVVSPGVPVDQLAHETVPVIAEVELPFFVDKKIKPSCIVAVTGTNGKTTIVNQIAQACELTGRKHVLCGNVGIPVSRVAEQLNGSINVIEVSSFMLEQTQVLHPHIAVITNITADHLDRHHNLAEYMRCKARISDKQTRHDYLIVNWDDPHAREVGETVARRRRAKVIWYSTDAVVKGYYIKDGGVYENRKLRRDCKLVDVQDLGGMPHTVSNALAVIAVGRKLKLPIAKIVKACRYVPQAHRIELVADFNGVAFYNDSKATNIASTLAAVRSFNLPVCLLLCGQSKGQDYHELLENLPPHVDSVIVFGAIKEQVVTIANELQLSHVHAVENLEQALQQAVRLVKCPAVVLFSPSGSSFDQFNNYQERGEKFRELVQKMVNPIPRYARPTDVNL